VTDTDLFTSQWRKSRYSNASGSCVEVAQTQSRVVAVRDTKDRGGPALAFGSDAWRAFMTAVRSDRPINN
jgi:hypothetical protein